MFVASEKTKDIQQSGIRTATDRCAKMGGVNLGQGICDLPIEDSIKQAAYHAIENNKNIYSPCEGLLVLREAIAQKLFSYNKITADPATEVIVTHGATGAFVCAIMTLFNPGDEVILFEPFYSYHRNALEINNIKSKAVAINLDDFSIDFDEVEKSITPKTKGIVICTPCNPCGKVFSKDELITLGRIAKKHGLYIITDEIYEYITYPGFEHYSLASLEDFKERTITISGFSKTYNMTGWRLGYASGPAPIIERMALVQDLLYVCPAAPLQYAVLAAFQLDSEYYTKLKQVHLENRDMVVNALRNIGFKFTVPQGAYYILIDFSARYFNNDEDAANIILEQAKVAMVPGRAFYVDANKGKNFLRLCYALNKDRVSLGLEQLKAVVM